jgi:arylsulfatase A-like enzyme
VKLSRRQVLGGAAAALAGTLGRCAPRRRRPPNLLFVHTDQLRADALSVHGNPHLRTPHLDGLVAEGVSFLLSYAASPVCVPARATWYTGRLPREHGALDNASSFTRQFPDLGSWLDDAGYRSVYVGKWHVPRPPEASFRHLHHGRGTGAVGDAAIAEAAEAFLVNYSGEAPFFFNVGFLQPHDICFWYEDHLGSAAEPPEFLLDRMPPLPANARAVPVEAGRVQRLRRWQEEIIAPWSEAAWRHALWAYYRQIEMVDAEIGRVLAALGASPHRDDTIVLFTSDHGEMAGSHSLVLKDTFYEESARVPLVLWAPERFAGGRHDAVHVVHGVDVFPTLCDFAQASPPPGLTGHSLRPLVEGRRAVWPEHRIFESGREGRMVRTARHKYVGYAGDATEQVFDVVADPGELVNLAERSSAAGLTQDLRRRLEEAEPSAAG